jgi:isomerase DpgB
MSAKRHARTAKGDIDALAHELGFHLDVHTSRPLDELTQAVDDVCRRATEQPEAVVVLRLRPSAPEARGWPGEVPLAAVNRWERVARRLERLAAVTIAVADGTCGGPSLRLLLAADYRIATPDVRLMLPVNDGQFWPGMELYRIVHEIGLARARKIVLWGDMVTAGQALELGIVDQVSADAADAVRSAVLLLGRMSGGENAIRRQLLVEATTTTFEEALGVHLAACDRELRRGRAPLSG